jgi:transcription elongation factor Elf1
MKNNESTEIKPCPFCGSKNIKIYDIDNDGWIKDILIVCQDCEARTETRINRQEYVSKGDKAYAMVDEDKFAADIQLFGLEKWNTRA